MNLSRKALFLLATIFLPTLLSGNVARSQDTPEPAYLPVDVMQVLELPVSITNPVLSRTEKGYLLKCEISNSSNDRILGLTYLFLVLDPANKVRMIASRTEAFKLAGYSIKDLTFQTPKKLKLKLGDHVVLAVEQLISRESIWVVLNSRQSLEAYGRGDSYLIPEVKRMLNQVDSKPRLPTIY